MSMKRSGGCNLSFFRARPFLTCEIAIATFDIASQAPHLGTVPLADLLEDVYVHDMINEPIDNNFGNEYQPLLMQLEAEVAFGLLTPPASPKVPDRHLAYDADFAGPFFEWPADFQEGPGPLLECPCRGRDNMQPFLLHETGDDFDDAVSIITAGIQEAGLPEQALLLGPKEMVYYPVAEEHAIMGVDNCFPTHLIEEHSVPPVWWPSPVRNAQA